MKSGRSPTPRILHKAAPTAMPRFMKRMKFGPLRATVVETPAASGGSIERTVVLLHGYGAPGTDLVGLHSSLQSASRRSDQGVRYVFFEAPHPLAEMGPTYPGRAWWPIDMMQLQVAVMTQNFEALAQAHPPGIDEASRELDQALRALVKETNVTWEQLFVGGFSQGAMLSCNWALHHTDPIAGLIQLSGTVLCQPSWQRLLGQRQGLAVFQSHSPQDPVLPFVLAERLRDMMLEAGLRHTWISFGGGHGIGPSVLSGLAQFLS